MSVQPDSTDQIQERLVGLVREIHESLLDLDFGGRLDPRVHQGWWVLLDTAARREDVIDFITANPSMVITLIGDDAVPWDPALRMTAFYVTWQVFRRSGLVAEQNALLGALEVPNGEVHPLGPYGGMRLIRAFRALLTANLAGASEPQLREAFEDASRIVRMYPQVLAFNRLRRSVGTALLEALGEEEQHSEYAQAVLRAVREDFVREHEADPRWLTPQLRAEALAAEARLLCLPLVEDYDQAMRLIAEARRLDRRSEDESQAQLQARLVAYEQQMLLVRSLRRVRDVEQVLTRKLEERGQATAAALVETQEEYRRESIQLLGLLAAVIALITSVAGNRGDGGLGVLLLQTLATGGVILLTFALFPLIVQGPSRHRWLAAAAGAALLVASVILFTQAPQEAQYAPDGPSPTPQRSSGLRL
ncbi:hypothetical protein TH66_13015 [Carbonactinospora thermoautotrophica]|uniref:Uncharacterized protein n=1 Tax=Carbonactinospora thermoautotrophica TaxID=1469144 RepID=A0A132N0U9_9ACTN|nr:hypothetical protein [Carbonactinospora thermoautotrophica]KWX03713.1 hypothetical protein TH66_13015 [Carbonactinospora thermoautotrophica]KWX09168.1 hypothetical protein TR74_11250 [Carbonactinospora thermoautotrophica]